MITYYAWVPVLAMGFGGCLATVYHVNARLMSAIQHLAAGIILAVVACEFVPDVLNIQSIGWPVFGFMVGMCLMLVLKVFSERCRQLKRSTVVKAALPIGMIAAIAFDIWIDGMLMGVGFMSSHRAGLLITFALSVEICFLGLALVGTCRSYGLSKYKSLGITFLTALCAALGFFLSLSILTHVAYLGLVSFESFGSAALLYLAVEELLVEAHDVAEDLPWMTAPFFIGFLAVMIFEKL